MGEPLTSRSTTLPDPRAILGARGSRRFVARSRAARAATLLLLAAILGSCQTRPPDAAVEAAERRAAQAERMSAEEAARAQQATARAERLGQEARRAREAQTSLERSLDESRQRADAAEAEAARTRTAVADSQRELASARDRIAGLEQLPGPETVVPLGDFQRAQADNEALRQEIEALRAGAVPVEAEPRSGVYEVTYRGPTEMVLDEPISVSLEVSVPTGEPLPPDAAFRAEIAAVSQHLRATLSGSNFEITSTEDLIQTMTAGRAVWDYKIRPLALGDQTLYASITQYTEDDPDGLPVRLRTDSWDIRVSVDPAPRILAAISRNIDKLTIGFIMFVAGIIGEMIRRRVFGKA